ncbi:hypothetical protein AHAS_Ahas18G0061300 [Arachis hypogaea]
MASPITSQENATYFSCACQWLRQLPKKSCKKATNVAKKIKKSGQDDPRRITHSLKVGFALTLVSMFFYVQALYDSFGVNALWAIMTVVVVMEFSVGATLGKGLNRMAATLLGGFLGFGVQQLATLPGKTNQPILLAIFLFIIGFINDSFNVSEEKNEKSFAEEYESVLNSKTKEENMANLASWEPRHGKFQFNHPWKQYLKVGNSTRQCAYKIEALDYHIKSKIQITHELRNKIKDTCQHICLESGKALKELSLSIKSMKCLSKTNYKAHIANAKEAIESLSTMLKSNLSGGVVEVNLLEVVAIAAMASLLMDVVISIERISEQVDELASLAHFKSHNNNVHEDQTKATRTRPLPLLREGIMKRFFPRDKMPHHHNNRIHESSICSPKQNRSSTIEVIVQ